MGPCARHRAAQPTQKEIVVNTQTQRIQVTLKIPTHVGDLKKGGEAIVASMTNNPYFPNVAAQLGTVSASLTVLGDADALTKTKKGTVPARNAARANVVTNLHGLKMVVQQRADADPENAAAIIASSGMTMRKVTVHAKAPFVAKPGPVSGSVHLVARAASRRASYEWQWSGDGGKSWTSGATTLQAKTTLTGLPVATSCQFRHRAVTKTGEGDWSQVVVLIVK
jgi:hypothetical protein